MSDKTGILLGVAILILACVIATFWTISAAVECGNKGGLYQPGGKDRWPACVKEVK